ncbi:MAG: DivIVA domain-containing protein [Micropruina sp.]|uniref:DivIVA domain-containing protein n=1 Tax=Micropruina sp. TaxID=2737536 RepID=UPI0039E25520
MSQQPEETVGLDLFDETASAAGSFPHSMLGYERQAVDAYIRDIERQLSSAKRKVRSLQKQLAAQADETDYSRLGAHTGDLLRAAERQAAEITQSAQLQAEQIIELARREAAERAANANQDATKAMASGMDDLQRLREELAGQTAAELAAAQQQARTLREAAESHRAMVLADADRNAAAIREQASLEAEQLRQVAQREVADVRAALAKEQEQSLESMQQRHAEVTRTLIELSERARQQSEEFGVQMAHDAQLADERRNKALAEADQIVATATEQARAAVADARAKAAKLMTEAGVAEAQKIDQLNQEITGLERRKKALIDALHGLSALATSTVADFQGDQEAEAHASEVARAADEADTAVLHMEEADTAIQPAVDVEDDDATRVQPAVVSGGGKRH